MPFSNQVVQAIEAGCLHLAETLVGMGQPAETIIPFLISQYRYLGVGDAEVIEAMARNAELVASTFDNLPPDQPIPTYEVPIEPTVAAGTIDITTIVEIIDPETGEVIRIPVEIVVPESMDVRDIIDAINDEIERAIDEYRAALHGIEYDSIIATIFRGGQ